MHTALGTGLRYLTYVLEEPRSTLARRFDAMRARMAGPAAEVADPVELVNRLCDNLVRENLMDPRPTGPEAAFSLARDLTVAALSPWPGSQKRLAAQAVWNLAYVFRQYPPTPALAAELGMWRRSMKTAGAPATARLAASYMGLRCDDGAGRDTWKLVHDRMAADPGYHRSPLRITAAALADGWPIAASLLRSLFTPGRVRRSFYLSFLAAEFAMRAGQPRVAARHLEDIVEWYCPGLLAPEVERRRERCRAAWRSGAPIVDERLPLLA